MAHLIDGADSPCKTDKGESGVDVEGKLSGVSTCTREKGNEAVNTSDLVEHLRERVSRAGYNGGVAGSHSKEDDKNDASLEIEKTKHGSERSRPELVFKSEFHESHM